MLAHLVAMLAYVGLMFAACWPMLSRKIRKMGMAKKHCKTQDILMVGGLSWGYVGHLEAMLAYLEGNVGPSWGYVGPSWGYVGPSWSYVGPAWSYVGPSWGYVGPSWGLYMAHLEAMLVRLEACVAPC